MAFGGINVAQNSIVSKTIYDKETGKPKGYGFCEYRDPEAAMSAVRNLNGREINGRPLRVRFGRRAAAAASAAAAAAPRVGAHCALV